MIVKDINKSVFKPVTIQITFESLEEVNNLLARLALSAVKVNSSLNSVQIGCGFKAIQQNRGNNQLFRMVDQLRTKSR